MKKWGTKSEFSGAIIFGTLAFSYFTDNKYNFAFWSYNWRWIIVI